MAGRRGIKIYNDPRWKKARKIVLERAEFRCEKCFRLDNFLEVHHVHHIAYNQKHDEPVPEDYNVNKLQALCRKCHWQAHRSRRVKSQTELDWDRYVNELM